MEIQRCLVPAAFVPLTNGEERRKKKAVAAVEKRMDAAAPPARPYVGRRAQRLGESLPSTSATGSRYESRQPLDHNDKSCPGSLESGRPACLCVS